MKAVLVIDTPKNCASCPLWCVCPILDKYGFKTFEQILFSDMYGKNTCGVAPGCPLRPLPQKKEVDEQSLDLMWWSGEHDMAYDVGYNACLKEITGEEEKK